MTRRRFFTFFVGMIGLLNWAARRYNSATVTRIFPIAGSRFHRFPSDLERNDALVACAEKFEDEDSIAILTKSGVRLGYVPRRLVPVLMESKIVSVTVARMDRYSVPWKRVHVAVRTQST
jgi:hypothetical protein